MGLFQLSSLYSILSLFLKQSGHRNEELELWKIPLETTMLHGREKVTADGSNAGLDASFFSPFIFFSLKEGPDLMLYTGS